VVAFGDKQVFRVQRRLYVGGVFLVLGLALLGVGIGVVVAGGSHAASDGRPVLPIIGALWTWIGWRLALASVSADAEGVTVHNFGRSFSLSWEQVAEIRWFGALPCLVATNSDRRLKLFGLCPLRFFPTHSTTESLDQLNTLLATHHKAPGDLP
jgi:hypothetical protein